MSTKVNKHRPTQTPKDAITTASAQDTVLADPKTERRFTREGWLSFANDFAKGSLERLIERKDHYLAAATETVSQAFGTELTTFQSSRLKQFELAKASVRALLRYEPGLRPVLKKGGFLTRDSRVVERKKYGKPKARRSFQFSKR